MQDLDNKVITNITLFADSSGQNNPQYVYAKQHDANSRYLVAKIVGSGKDIIVTGTAQLNATKPDGTHSYVAGSINKDGTITIELTSNLLAVDGKISCDITIFNSEDEQQTLLTTSTFYILVDESNYDSGAIESTNEFSTVSDVLAQISAERSAAENAAENIKATLITKADGLILDGDKLQLTSDSIPIGDSVVLPTGTSSGTAGEKGEKGDKGEPGEKGADGTSITIESAIESNDDDGYNTVIFSDGNSLRIKNGSKGTTGEKGATGETGATGSDGKSAYQIWLEAGNVGNESTFLASLKGEKGDAGAKGDKGDKGDTGTAGVAGRDGTNGTDGHSPVITAEKSGSVTIIKSDGVTIATINDGEKGEKGDTGASGSDGYTPIKGTDYFTNSDKQEIIDAVIDALSTVAVTVDETNNITLNGDLSDGTYIVSYKNTDGSLSNIGTLTVGDATSEPTLSFFSVSYDDSVAVVAGTELAELNEVVKAVYTDGTQTSALTEGTDYSLSGTLVAGQTNVVTVTGKGTYASLPSVTFNVTVAAESVIPSYTNLVPTSLDPTNLTQVFNTTGYMDGARMSYTLSGGVLYRTDNSGGCCSGFIPFSSGNTFYIKADSITDTNTYTGGIVITRCLTGDTTVVASGATATAISKDTYWSHEKLSDNYYKVVLRHPYNESDGTVGFCVNAGGTGANLIVAKEPIE